MSESFLNKQLKPITKKEAKEDYNNLKNIKCSKINMGSLVGNKATDYFFFKYRLKTKSRKGISFIEFYNDFIKNENEYMKKKFIKNIFEYSKKNKINKELILYNIFRLYYGAISQFKPIIAKYIYCKYKPKTILDFSAGWGGRCLGAMSMNIDYIGFDTNKNLKIPYKKMIEFYEHTSKVNIYFVDSSKVDFSKFDYDMVFTSPPYYDEKIKAIETYEYMKNYKDKDDFNNKFFFPIVKNTYYNLKKNGIYALNIPIYMYNDIISILGKCNKKIPLQITDRHAEKVKQKEYIEFIYIWIKK
jgi:16S rRNA G966 N2-methylase RsmD